MRISDWSSDVCSSDLNSAETGRLALAQAIDPHQHEHLPATRRQRQDGFAQPRLLLRLLDRDLRQGCGIGQLDRIHRYVIALASHVPAPPLLVEQVAGDAVQQRLPGLGRLVVAIAQQPSQAFLGAVPRVLLAGSTPPELKPSRWPY